MYITIRGSAAGFRVAKDQKKDLARRRFFLKWPFSWSSHRQLWLWSLERLLLFKY
jgi:hypothetical protein